MKKGTFIEVGGVRAEVRVHDAPEREPEAEVTFTGGAVAQDDWRKLKGQIDEAIVRETTQ